MSEKKKLPIPLILLGIVIVGGGGFAIEQYLAGIGHVRTDDAYVSGNLVHLSPQIAGTVVALNFAETQYVTKGQLLAQIDPRDSKIALQQGEANLAQTVREVAQIFANEQRDAANVASQQTQLSRAEQDLARDQTLVAVHGVSQETLQHDQNTVQSGRAALAQAQAVLASTKAAIAGTTPSTHPRVLQAETALRSAWLAESRTSIVAPVSGYVVRKSVQLGEQIAPSSEMAAILPTESVWVDANFKETQLGGLRIGQPVTVSADIYGDHAIFHGKVMGLIPGTGNALSLLPAQNASGNWIKIVQRLPVRIGLDPKELEAHPLLLGLSANVDVDTHDQSGTAMSKQSAWPSASKTDAYAGQDDGVDAAIQKIITDNLSKSAAGANGGGL